MDIDEHHFDLLEKAFVSSDLINTQILMTNSYILLTEKDPMNSDDKVQYVSPGWVDDTP